MSLAAGEAPADATETVTAHDLRCRELPAPPEADPVAVFAAAPANRGRFCWIQPSRDLALVGVGATLRWRPVSREGRFREAARFAGRLARQLSGDAESSDGGPGGCPAGPILCGGFAFDSEPAAGGPRWAEFGSGMLMLPELLGIVTKGRLRWLVTAPADLLGEASQRAVRLLESAAAGAVRSPGPLTLLGPSGDTSDNAYLATIRAALAEIRTGAFEKVVPARQVTVRLATSPGAAAAEILSRLEAEYPTATTFAVSCGDLTLLGATPELLVRTGNGIAEADALAGSCPRNGDAATDAALAKAMLVSPKERHEHDVVVEHLLGGMNDAGVLLDPCPPEPHVRSLPAIQHLCTPVRGHLPTTAGTIFRLADALHPTPAVAGQPVAPALDFLRRHESVGRGWFAGPVGWTDLAGNGEFCMALRTGLLDPGSNELTLFAGSGVVEGSDPAAELQETAAKLDALPAVSDNAPLGGAREQ